MRWKKLIIVANCLLFAACASSGKDAGEEDCRTVPHI